MSSRGIFRGRCYLCGAPSRGGYCYEHAWAAKASSGSLTDGRRAAPSVVGDRKEKPVGLIPPPVPFKTVTNRQREGRNAA